MSIDDVVRPIARFKNAFVVVVNDALMNDVPKVIWDNCNTRGPSVEKEFLDSDNKHNIITIVSSNHNRKTKEDFNFPDVIFTHLKKQLNSDNEVSMPEDIVLLGFERNLAEIQVSVRNRLRLKFGKSTEKFAQSKQNNEKTKWEIEIAEKELI